MTDSLFNLFSQEVVQSSAVPRCRSEVMVWRTSLISSQIQNADSAPTITSSMVTGSDAPRGHQLSTKWNTPSRGTSLVFFAKILHRMLSLISSPLVFPFQESSMTYTLRFHIGTTIKFSFRTSIHVTDQRMVTQLSRSGVTTSWISVTISDATSVPDQREPTTSVTLSCGAEQLSQTSSVKLSHSLFP